MQSVRTLRILVFLLVLTVSAPAFCAVGIEAITKPSADITLSFVQPGRIAKVLPKEGDSVKAQQVIVQQDDAVAQAQLEQTKALSENTTQIEASKASLEQKKIDLDKLQWAAERGAATELEVAHAKLEAVIADMSLKIAIFEHEQNKRKYKEERISVENMTLKSPISGLVEKIEIEVGESVNGLEDVVRVVRVDPLWIDVHVPLHRTKNLKVLQAVDVVFPNGEVTTKGKVIFVAAVADAASSTLRTRIEVANKTNRSAGEHVKVIFPNMRE